MGQLKSKSIFLLIIIILSFSWQANAQCISFARNVVKPRLEPFVHDGNFSAAYMEEGESAELHKVFFEGEEYRLVVAGIDYLPKLRVVVMDENRVVVFDNAQHAFVQEWNFTAMSTGAMIVQIKVPDSGNQNIMGGCVAILFGVKPTPRRR